MECWGQPRQYFSLCPPRLVRGSPYTVLLTNTFSITLPQSPRSGRAHTPKGEARPHTLTTVLDERTPAQRAIDERREK